MTTPDNLPPLPPVPATFDRWEYRGMKWSSGQYVQYAYYPSDLCSGWRVSTGEGCTSAEDGTHYLEAVRDEPAKADPCRDCKHWTPMNGGHICAAGASPDYASQLGRCAKREDEPAKEVKPMPGDPSEWIPQPASGVEARVCEDIAVRQRLGIAKYGCTVEQSPDDMLKHAMCEAYDLSVYLRAEWERKQASGWRPIETAPRDGSWLLLWTTPPEGKIDIPGIGRQCTVSDSWMDDCGESAPPPTHWQPLPQPPAERRQP